MTVTTFKIFKPSGDCRRVTFNAVPELAAINEVVDGLVDFESRDLVYMDSEGDRIIIKSSRDVLEAVRDTNATTAKTVKLWIRFRRDPQRAGRPCGRGAAKANCKDNNPHQRPRRSRGLFGHPGWVQHHGFEFNDDVADIIGAFFPRCFISRPHCRKGESDNDEPTSPTGDSKEEKHNTKHDKKAEPKAEPNTASESPKEDASAAASSTPRSDISKSEAEEAVEEVVTATSPVKEQQDATLYVEEVVEDAVPESDIPPQAQENENELDPKLSMLREMGFDLPDDVAKNMIRELNGRMDLIVRALVANNK